MRKSSHILLIILVVCALGVSAWLVLRSREPNYRGEPANFWIRSLTNANPGEAEKALEEIGLPALPYVVRAFENKDRPLAKLWARLWSNAPAFARTFMPEPFPWETIHFSLTETIGFIGRRHRFSDGAGDTPTTPELECAVQALARSLSDADVRERIACAQAMAFIGPNGKNAAPALIAMFDRGNSQEKIFVCQAFATIGPCSTAQESVRALIEGLNSQDTGLTISAADALGGIGSQAVPAVPALVKMLANGNENVRKSAVRALARIGNLPNNIRPQLHLLLIETNDAIRTGAALALLRINPNETAAASLVKDCLTPEKPPNLRSGTLYLIMGSKSLAEIFLPELRKLEDDPNVNVATFARKALKQINPDAGAKLRAK